MSEQPTETLPPVRVFQMNANRKNDVTHTMLNHEHIRNNYDVLLIQEPWFGRMTNGTRIPVAGPG